MNIRSALAPFREDKPFALLALALLLIPLVFFRLTYEKFETVKFAVFYILFGLSLVFLSRQAGFKFSKAVVWTLAAIILFSMTASIFSPDKIYSVFGRGLYWTGAIFMICWCLFVAVLSGTLTPKRLDQVLNIFLVAGLANAVLSVLQAFSIGYYESPYTIGYLLRPPALFGNPNFTSIFLVVLIPLAIRYASSAKTFALRLYFYTSAFILLFASMVLSSRGAALGLGAGLAVMLALSLWRKQFKLAGEALAAIILAAVLFVTISAPFRATYTGTGSFDTAETNVITRLQMWHDGLAIMAHHPLTGIGFGNLAGLSHDAHNLFLNLGIAGGLPLALAFFALVAAAAVLGLRSTKNSSIQIVLLAGLAAILIASSFNPMSLPNWIILGVLLAGLFFEHRRQELPSTVPLRFSVAVLGSLIMLFGISFFAGQVLLYQALKANIQRSDYQAAAKLTAAARLFDPLNDMAAQQSAGLKIYTEGDTPNTVGAIEYYETLHPQDPDVVLRVGRLYHQLFRQTHNPKYFDLGAEKISQALQLEPRVANGYFYLAYYYYETQNWDQVADVIHRGLVVTPDDSLLWTLAANVAIGQQDWTAARTDIESLYKLDTKNKILKHMLESLKRGQPVTPLPLAVPDNPYLDPFVVPTNSL
jgi:O-antigen ligase